MVHHGMRETCLFALPFVCVCCSVRSLSAQSFTVLGHAQVRIDHKNGTLHFGADQLEGDRLRDHIAVMAQRFARALTMIDPNVDPAREQRRIAVSSPAHCAQLS